MSNTKIAANIPAARESIVNWIKWPTLRPTYRYAVVTGFSGAEHRVRYAINGGGSFVKVYVCESPDGFCANYDEAGWAKHFVRDDVFTLADNDATDRHAERRAEESRYWY